MAMELNHTRDVSDEEVVDLVLCLDSRISVWVSEVHVSETLRTVRMEFFIDADDRSQGTEWATVEFDDIVAAMNRATALGRDTLCCADTMFADSLGDGCSLDADIILQHAILGGVIWG